MSLDIAPLNQSRVELTFPESDGLFFWAEADTGFGRKATVQQIVESGVQDGADLDIQFGQITDTPASFAGAGLQLLRVNAAADAVEYVALTASLVPDGENLPVDIAPTNFPDAATLGGLLGSIDGVIGTILGDIAALTTTFVELTDTPSSYAGHGGKAVFVKGAEDGLEFANLAVGGSGVSGSTTSGNTLQVDLGAVVSAAHGLGVIPENVQARFVCNSADLGYSAGDEILGSDVEESGNGIYVASVWADATSYGVSLSDDSDGWLVHPKGGGSRAAMDRTKWSAKAVFQHGGGAGPQGEANDLLSAGGTSIVNAKVGVNLNVKGGQNGTNTTFAAGANTFQFDVADASESVKGVIEIATQAEADAGASTTLAITPDTLSNYPFPTASPATEAAAGIAEIATQAETDAGTDDTRFVTPLKLANYPNLGLTSGSTISANTLDVDIGGSLSAAHGLGHKPKIVQAVFECSTADGTYAVGDQIDAGDIMENGGGQSVCTTWSDATNYGAALTNDVDGWNVNPKTGGARVALTRANWKLRVSYID